MSNKRNIMPRLDIPTATATQRYGRFVAEVMEQLALSRVSAARGRAAEDFSWSFDYEQALDPETYAGVEQFTQHLLENSVVYLVARGFHWKGKTIIPFQHIPHTILAKFQERARLICGMQARSTKVDEPAPERKQQDTDSDAELKVAVSIWLDANPDADARLVSILNNVITQICKH